METEYKPSPIYAYKVPKAKGGFRSIYPPSIKDREYQRNKILPILEDAITPSLSPYSYAFQKGIPLHDPILYLKKLLENGWNWAVQIDINKYFDNIDREALYRKLEPIIPTETLEDIKKTYNVPYYSKDGRLHEKNKGIYQGSSISPILSNLTLTDFDFDTHWNNKDTRIIRYCDDILILSKGRKKAKSALSSAKKYLYDKGFTIKPTKPINLNNGYVEFLGLKISNHNDLVDLSIKDNRIIEMVDKLNSSNNYELSAIIRGWINHYSLNGQYNEGFYKIQELVINNKGIEYWNTLTEGLIPYPNSSNIQKE